jgi:hypothetical protein
LAVLYNAFYGLAQLVGNWPVVEQAALGLEVAFFVVAAIVCPVCFIVGGSGSIVVLVMGGLQNAQ